MNRRLLGVLSAAKVDRGAFMVRTNWESERDAAVAAARGAVDIMAHWAGRFTARSKGLNDLVTEADLAVQTSVRESLLRKFPGDDFLGEEDAVNIADLKSTRRWIVDPIDGTTNFVHGFPFYCVSIALEVEGELTVGVILDPSRNECFCAVRGQGATLNGARVKVSSCPKLSEGMVCVGLSAVPAEHPRSLETMVEMTRRTRSIRRLGSAAISLAYLSAGRLDAFFAHIIQPWDVAAGVLLIREAGGRVTNIGASDHNLYIPHILATNGLIHDEVSRSI
jgi:myo-inositol-1(or 4)-monophosphatase